MKHLLHVATNLPRKDRERIERGLSEFNRQKIGPAEKCMVDINELAVVARNSNNELIGGLLGELGWGWIFVRALWVDEAASGVGVGSAILERAEREAAARGIVGVYLNTVGFHAPDFYLERGYEIFGTLEDYPPGGKLHFFKKSLLEA